MADALIMKKCCTAPQVTATVRSVHDQRRHPEFVNVINDTAQGLKAEAGIAGCP